MQDFILFYFCFFLFQIESELVCMNETGKQIYHIYLHTIDDVHVLYYFQLDLTRKMQKCVLFCIQKQIVMKTNKNNQGELQMETKLSQY